jgi:dTDP-4-amino-4,6-dideoxygalactose transaminase
VKFYSSFERSSRDIQSIEEVLESGFVSRGPVNRDFERTLSTAFGALSVLSNSGTSALLTSLHILNNYRQKLTVWTSPINFSAVAHACSFLDYKLDYVDINRNDFNICVDNLRQKLSSSRSCNTLPDILVVIHLGGVLQDMKEIYKLSQEYGFKIVEDACHAFGNNYPCGSPVGSCTYSDATVFSFHALKTISCGEGGLLTTKCNLLHQKALRFTTLSLLRGTEKEPWVVESQSPALNFRMSDISAALGLSQYRDIEQRAAIRRSQLSIYINYLDSNYIRLQASHHHSPSDFRHLIIASFSQIDCFEKKLLLYNRLNNAGIRLSLHYKPIYKHLAFLDDSKSDALPNTERYYLQSFTLPASLNLSATELLDCIAVINDIARII